MKEKKRKEKKRKEKKRKEKKRKEKKRKEKKKINLMKPGDSFSEDVDSRTQESILEDSSLRSVVFSCWGKEKKGGEGKEIPKNEDSYPYLDRQRPFFSPPL